MKIANGYIFHEKGCAALKGILTVSKLEEKAILIVYENRESGIFASMYDRARLEFEDDYDCSQALDEICDFLGKDKE